MSKKDSEIDSICAFNDQLTTTLTELLKGEIKKLTQDNPDPIVREKNAKELVRLFDAVFEKIKEIKGELTRVSLENKNLKEVLSKKNNDPAKKNNLSL